METNQAIRPTLVRMSVLIREETVEALRELANDRSEGVVSREIRQALDRYIETEKTKAS